MTILITGGTGKTGGRVSDLLTDLGHPARPVTRHTAPRFDWLDTSTWNAAVDGCESAYLTFQPDLGLSGADEVIAAFAARAVSLGCRRLVLLSGRGEEGARRAELALTESGADWTILRSSFFMQNFTESFFADEIASGRLTMVEHTVGEPFVDADDVAEVAVAALRDRSHVGRIHELTGPRLLTFGEAVRELAHATHQDIWYRELPVAAYAGVLVSAGLPEEEAAGLAHLFHEVLDGRNARIEDGVRRVLGREPRDFRDFLARLPSGAVRG